MRSASLLCFVALLTGCDGFRTHDTEYDFPPQAASTPAVTPTTSATPPKKPMPLPSPGFNPFAVDTSLTPYVEIKAGDHYTCALRDTNQLDCWGDRLAGQPAMLTEISGSAKTACGVDPNGALRCWGAAAGFDAPIGEKLTSVGVGDGFACALDPNKHPHCWGPNAITPPADAILDELAVGVDHACGLDTKGLPVCWGNGNAAKAPLGAEPLFGIAAGPQTTCAIRSGSHRVHCWGLLEGSPVSDLSAAKRIAVTMGKVCAIRDDDDRLQCSGLAQTDDWLRPPPNIEFFRISIGATHACGLRHDNGLAVCWGSNTAGETSPPF